MRQDLEYDELKACLRELFPLVAPSLQIPIEAHPLVVLEKLEASSAANALKGLKMALNDLIEMTIGLSSAEVREIDKVLTQAGVLSLTELRFRYSRTCARVLKRGNIKRVEEYYMLKGILDSGLVDSASSAYIQQLLSAYEAAAS